MPVPDFAHGVTNSSYWFAHLDSMSASPKAAVAKAGAAQTAVNAATASTGSGESFWDDLLDVVNPLQHLPVVSTIYRAVSGDKIGDVEKVAGDTLYGGPIGLVSSLADLAFEKITGKDFGDTVMSVIGLDDSDSNTALASNTSPAKSGNLVAAVTDRPGGQPLIVASATPLVNIPDAAPDKKGSDGNSVPATNAASGSSAANAAANSSTPVDISPDTDALLQALARNGVTGQMQAQALDAYRRTMQRNSGAIAPVGN